MKELLAAMRRDPSDVWGSPRWLVDQLRAEFAFTIDVCASPENAVCPRYFTEEDDGLAHSWAGEVCWMNPPFSCIGPWVEAARLAADRDGATVVCLVPVWSDRTWWRDHVADRAEIRWLYGRVQFEGRGRKGGFPWPCCLLIYRPRA